MAVVDLVCFAHFNKCSLITFIVFSIALLLLLLLVVAVVIAAVSYHIVVLG